MVKIVKFPQENGRLYLTEEEMKTPYKDLDPRLSVDPQATQFHILQKRPSYRLGETIRVRIQLYDGRGKKRQRGGDYLRIWMENEQLKANVAGQVIDYNNGTYMGLVTTVWPGHADIRVSVQSTREAIAVYYSLYRRYHSLWVVRAEFSNDNETRIKTMCSVVPTSRDEEWCDVTSRNQGFPWFCLKPSNSSLTCDTWTTTWSEWTYVHTYIGSREWDIIKR